ncbi:MAG: hypothetical protein CBD54_003105 [Alphaproteobacteria bacterium TMED194]|jgi:hypothetical protein|nr:MAG: hypothetical protein CBD54_003105 [Alphaproteobacteria bacterium TMED194]|tara:strand:- start:78 stop:608 length:531 start_codon:yes stop_codon:yes gene_type:complete
MARIDDFKANLIGGGARPNQFRVTITPPPGIAIGLDVRRSSFLAKASNLPGQTLGEIPVPFRGRNIYIAGDREFETWSTTFINDTDFMVRNAIERWMNGINDLVENTGVSTPAEYSADLFVEQLDRDDTVLKNYIFRNAHPLTVAQIDVAYESTNALEEFEVTWRYQHFEASGVNF